MKDLLVTAKQFLDEGNIEALEEAVVAIKGLPKAENGVYDLSGVDRNKYVAGGMVYPLFTAYETVCNKKEGYPELLSQMRSLNEALGEEFTFENVSLFLKMLMDTITQTSPEIYEYYRELIDIFRENVKKAVDVFYLDGKLQSDNQESKKIFESTIEDACEKGVLLDEKYLINSNLTSGVSPESSSQGDAKLEIVHVMNTARSAVIEIKDGGRFFSLNQYTIYINGEYYGTTDKVITSLFDLKPDHKYVVEVYREVEKVGEVSFRTDYEYVTLDVTKFGAKGDGEQDDTHFIQAAIMACPMNSRVYIPEGTYRITSLFLKSNVRIELAKGAHLKAFTERERFPIFPGMFQSYDETDEYNLGTWEGNPLPMFSGIICGIDVKDVVIYGQGTIDGNASKENWWNNPKVMNIAFRPRLFFISGCQNVTLQGVTFCNSPSWTLHPYFSNDLKFIDIAVENPADSPNTDGLDPESCKNIDILGVRFSLGDDCIAVKSGKIYMGKKHKTPCENILIRQCLMENGHGAVTLGSEMAGGVVNLTVEDCYFRHTDRGLRIKTRRGRGKDAILSNIIFRNLTLDHVMTPLVVNSFYFCDPDGKTQYVQSREPYPVDDKTPSIKKMVFENMECTNCHVAAAYFDGLPEQKIEEIVMRNVSISYADNPKCDVPAMTEGVEKSSKRGLFARNVGKMYMENVTIQGQIGEAIELIGVDELEEK